MAKEASQTCRILAIASGLQHLMQKRCVIERRPIVLFKFDRQDGEQRREVVKEVSSGGDGQAAK